MEFASSCDVSRLFKWRVHNAIIDTEHNDTEIRLDGRRDLRLTAKSRLGISLKIDITHKRLHFDALSILSSTRRSHRLLSSVAFLFYYFTETTFISFKMRIVVRYGIDMPIDSMRNNFLREGLLIIPRSYSSSLEYIADLRISITVRRTYN